MRSINELVKEAHDNAVSKGWWMEDRSFGELIAIMHSELSKALDDYRNGELPTTMWYEKNEDGELKKEAIQIDDDGSLVAYLRNWRTWLFVYSTLAVTMVLILNQRFWKRWNTTLHAHSAMEERSFNSNSLTECFTV